MYILFLFWRRLRHFFFCCPGKWESIEFLFYFNQEKQVQDPFPVLEQLQLLLQNNNLSTFL